MTMRYYLPLYSALSVLAGWAIYNLYQRARRAGNDLLVTRLLLLALGMSFRRDRIVSSKHGSLGRYCYHIAS